MTQQEKILDRIKKLFALADSANVNEASSAAAQAQRLMERHAIDAAMLRSTSDEPDEVAGEQQLYKNERKVMQTWRAILGQELAKANRCTVFQRGRHLYIIGRPGDAANTRYMHEYVMREIDRLTKIEAKKAGSPGRTWTNNFRLGAVSEVGHRVLTAAWAAREAARQDAAVQCAQDNDGGAALVRIDSALATLDEHRAAVDAYCERNLNIKAQTAAYAGDREARAAGERAGASINIGGAAGALGKGRLALGKG